MSYLSHLQGELSALRLKCDYWDVRIEDTFETSIQMENGEVISCSSSPSVGVFLRALKNGFWLYQATTDLNSLAQTLESLTNQSVLSTEKSIFAAKKQEPFISLQYTQKKFSAVPLEDKLSAVKTYSEIFQSHPKIASTWIGYKDVYKTKSFLNSVGTCFEYDLNQGGFSSWYTLREKNNLFEDYFHFYLSDFSDVSKHQGRARTAIAESERFLKAPAVEPGKYRVLLDPEVAGIFTHESFGHKSEADFMLGNDQALKDWSLGKKIAADCLSIVDFGGHEKTSGYCPIDDDGVPAQKNYLIKNGILTGRLHSLQTAAELAEEPTGNSRALNFEFEPIVRMTSTYIEPGTESFESLLPKCEGALLIEGAKHGSGLINKCVG